MRAFAYICLYLFVASSMAPAHASVVQLPGQNVEASRAHILKRFHRKNLSAVDQSEPDLHVQFKDRADAIAWLKQVEPRMKALSGAKKFDILTDQDPRNLTVQSYVHEIWTGFEKLFPEQTKGLAEPPVIVIDSEVQNAFVPSYILKDDTIAHTVIVFTGLIDLGGGIQNKDGLTGVIAHEITHSVFKHLVSPYKERINKFYQAKPEQLGFDADRDANADQLMAKWTDSSKLIGDLSNPELYDFPTDGRSTPVMTRLWIQLVNDLSDPKTNTCSLASKTLTKWASLYSYNAFDSVFTIPPGNLSKIALTSVHLERRQQACFGPKREGFLDALSKVLGVPAQVLGTDPELQQWAHDFDSAPDVVVGVRRIVRPFRVEMAYAENSVDFNSLGEFTREEHADDVSLIVHKYLGLNPLSLANFFRNFLTPADKLRCDQLIQTNGQIAMGAFSDEHRATCYRISHLVKLNDFINLQKTTVEAFATDYIRKTTN